MIPTRVQINEVCPRDGWQNYAEFIPTETKIEYIKRMIDSGAAIVEVTSFVSPKAIPQFADAPQVAAAVTGYAAEKGVELMSLALNGKGVERSREAGIHYVEFVISASETHNMKNSRRTLAQSLAGFKEMAARSEGLKMQLSIPCAFGCPFGEEIPLDRLLMLCDEAQKVGVTQFGLADSAGLSTPLNLRTTLQGLKKHVDPGSLSMHLHDTRGMGIANAYVALEEGISRFDTSLGGMGGCPFIPGAKGNIATEDLLNMLQGMGVETGMDLDATVALALDMGRAIGCEPISSMSRLQREGQEA